jgi:hypothetical protein
MRNVLWGLAIMAIATWCCGPTAAGEIEDNATAHLIAGNMKTSGQLQGYKIGVTCKDGVAWLTGTVTSNQQGETALAIARQTEGVTQVVNRLTFVEGEPTPAPSSRRQIQQAGAVQNQGPMIRQASPTPAPQARPIMQRQPQPIASRGGQQAPVAVASRGQHLGGPVPHQGGYNQPVPAYSPGPGGVAPARYDNPQLPGYAWPSYAPHPNYAALSYPQQYSPTAWPYIGPFYPYPQVPLGWRKVTLEWDDGWWMLDFKD